MLRGRLKHPSMKVKPIDANASHDEYFNDYSRVLPSTFNQFGWTWTTALLSGFCTIFTAIFAYNCSLSKPMSTMLLPSKSTDTLLILNLLSHGSIQLLSLLTSQAFEAARWAMASSKNGISASSFLVLSRATSLIGVFDFFRGHSVVLKHDGHQVWGLQRYHTTENIN
jgi:hypothetical protein